MRISFDAKRFFANHTGLGNYSRALITNLVRYRPDDQLHLFAPKAHTLASTRDLLAAPQVHVHTREPGWSPLWRTWGMTKAINRVSPDIFHGLSHELPFGRLDPRIKQVVTMHDVIFKHLPGEFSWFDRKVYDFKWRYSIDRADRIIAISRFTAEDLQRTYRVDPAKIEVIYQSCHADYYTDLPQQADIQGFKARHSLPVEYVLQVGSVVPRKRLHTTIQALHALRSEQPLPLVIVGDFKGSYAKEVRAQIDKCGLRDLVVFWPKGRMDVHALRMLYAGARFSVFLSGYEGFGLPVAESLLCGTPVLVSNATSVPEAAGPGGMLCELSDMPQIISQYRALMTDDKLVADLAARGRTYASEMFSPEKTTQQLIALYQDLLRA